MVQYQGENPVQLLLLRLLADQFASLLFDFALELAGEVLLALVEPGYHHVLRSGRKHRFSRVLFLFACLALSFLRIEHS